MSRIIIKNLPTGITDEKLRNQFSKIGVITDVQLKYTPEGKFRNFGFIGFEQDEDGDKAIKHFNNTFLRTSKIAVELCAALNDPTKPKAWSKYSKENQKEVEEEKKPKKEKKENIKKENASEILEKHKDDPLFIEFLEVHNKKGVVWENKFKVEDEKDSAAKVDIKTEEQKAKKKKKKKNKEGKTPVEPEFELFVAKIRNIPFTVKRGDLDKFFRPVKPHSIRIPPKQKGFAYVGFKTEAELRKAMLKDKSFLGGKQVEIQDFTSKDRNRTQEKAKLLNPKWIKQKESVQSESICESGKLFFRNLPYSVKEESIQKTFEKFGPVSDIDVPIDQNTRKLKGFGTVTFLMPEHAVSAYTALNGTLFHGRMFHILPGNSNEKDENEEALEGLSFKEKKEKKLKQQAGSSHNWNTLFLGENAVADHLSKKYETTKEQILSSETGGTSAAVRLALGETEIVLEMKKFLEENDVCLDSFNTVAKDRSKTVILAKNLPANTTASEIRTIFAKFGILGRVVLPPSGVTAVIEFLEPSEAKKGFKKLAYTRFKNLPLYLEWAPDNTFSKEYKQETNASRAAAAKPQDKTKKENLEDVDENEEPEEGTMLFIKNLSFETREDKIREHFKSIGQIHSVQVVMKLEESRGYGFIQFKTRKTTENALKNMQFSEIDGRKIELARSDRTLRTNDKPRRKDVNATKQTGTKILVRNIPFEANAKEVRDLFKAFGEIKTVRLPKKMSPGAESHRGFCFVDFITKTDAKTAFDALCKSTHLYGRRLVLEWAAAEDGVEELRKRTADKFSGIGSDAKRSRKSVFDTSEMDVEREEYGDN